jgi:environmental stress-induced protein Ves
METNTMTKGDPGYAVELVRHDDQHVSAWSGGTTTEIAIFPRDAIYGRRDFLWRVSSARVDAEASTFTPLPGYQRLLMVLEGDMTLRHEGHHSERLTPFEQDAFSGAWVTSSSGRARDFNVMLAQGCEGQLRADELAPGQSGVASLDCLDARDDARRRAGVIYVVDGVVVAAIGGGTPALLAAGDALLITGHRGCALPRVTVRNRTNRSVHLVTATLQCGDPADHGAGYTACGER